MASSIILPVITGIAPDVGSSSGGDLVKIIGNDFSNNVSVFFGDHAAEVIVVREELGEMIVDVRTPPHAPELVAVTLINLDENGTPLLEVSPYIIFLAADVFARVGGI